MFNKNNGKHTMFCNCTYCKNKRRSSGCYLSFIAFLIFVIVYQSFLLIFFPFTWGCIILFIEIILLLLLIIGIIL